MLLKTSLAPSPAPSQAHSAIKLLIFPSCHKLLPLPLLLLLPLQLQLQLPLLLLLPLLLQLPLPLTLPLHFCFLPLIIKYP
jgi:hypothetical protein